MIERSHSLHILRQLPNLGFRCVRLALELVVTACAIAWLNPGAASIAILACIGAAGVPLVANSVIAERDLRVRTHTGALARFHLDALLGRMAIEAHGALTTLEREHESLLTEWAAASLALQRSSIGVEGFQMLVGFGLAGWMLFGHLATDRTSGMLLLQMYWMLNLPALGYELALYAREYPTHRSTLLRLLEPLGAPDSEPLESHQPLVISGAAPATEGVHVEARGVHVRAAGNPVLEQIELAVAPGSHVAIVGASGAGKSTLVGLLLGWHRPDSGEILIDGKPIASQLDSLRRATAWVDPTVRLWNRPLLENLLYGNDDATEPIDSVLEATGLLSTIARLPNGLATPLGEGGALLSSGEAQSVRLARAMLKRSVRLAILDEPFMGLERERRRALLTQARQRWANSTLLYVTHDVSETRQFDRVIVVDRGRIVEDGHPKMLAQTSSRYRWMIQGQERLHHQFASSLWRRVRLDDGRIVQEHVNAIEQSA
jgi:ATP-binding cassette subfamily B protein